MPLERFGVRVSVSAPVTVEPALLMKPVLDGLISALHAHDGSAIELVADRLARSISVEPHVVRALLLDEDWAVLGTRKLLWPRGESVQWNPADDACVACELIVVQSNEWCLSGELFEVESPARSRATTAA
jgi:hypothetical protein